MCSVYVHPAPSPCKPRRHARAAHAPCTQLPGSVRRRSIGHRDRNTAPEITPSTVLEALRAPDDCTPAAPMSSRPPRVTIAHAARATHTQRCAHVGPRSMRAVRAHVHGVAGLSCSGPGLVVGGRIPLTLRGRLAGRVAAHLLPGLVVTGLAADVEVDELRALNLTRDAELCSKSTKKTHCADGTVSASRGSCEHDAWTSALFARGGGGSRAGRGGERTR